MGWLYTLFELIVSAFAVFGGYMLFFLFRGKGIPFMPEEKAGNERENGNEKKNDGKGG